MEPALKVHEVVTLYLSHSRATGLHCQKTLIERERVLGKFAEKHGAKTIEECKAHHLSDWIEGNAKYKSSSTRRAKSSMVKACFQWALLQGHIPSNPFREIRYTDAKQRQPMDDETLGEILKHSNKSFEKAVRFLRLTGCRVGQLCLLTWEDVDLEKGLMIVRTPSSRVHRIAGRFKTIVLAPEAVQLLCGINEIVRQDNPAGHVFLNHRNKPWVSISLTGHFSRLKKRINIKTTATLHCLRHAFAVQALRSGASHSLLANALSHCTHHVTERLYPSSEGKTKKTKTSAAPSQTKASVSSKSRSTRAIGIGA